MGDVANGALTQQLIKQFKTAFDSNEKNALALNICTKNDPIEVCVQRHAIETTNHIFTHKIDSEVKPMSNQKKSGNCWIFAALNVLRVPFMKHYQLEDFEFSQNYVYFWDKIERSNYFLRSVVDVLQKGEPLDGRLMSFFLSGPVPDGGQYDMIVNIVKKYGVVPKTCFPSTFCCDTTYRLNGIIKSKAREYVRDLHVMIQKGASEGQLEKQILGYMEEMYRIIVICLGIPPETFTWEYYNKSKAYCCIGPITPLKFYEDYVKPHCDIESKVCLVNDPRPENPYGELYTVEYLGNVVGGKNVLYLNLEVEELLKYAAESIKNNEPVWFGCDVSKRCSTKLGIQDLKLQDYTQLFGTDVLKSLSKAEKLLYGDSLMTHAMVFTGVSIDDKGVPTKFRVENSWGEEYGDKGYFVMTADWFKEFGFEVAIDKRFLPKEMLEILKKTPKVLPPWDPMGSLTQ